MLHVFTLKQDKDTKYPFQRDPSQTPDTSVNGKPKSMQVFLSACGFAILHAWMGNAVNMTHLHCFIPPSRSSTCRDEGTKVHCVWNDSRVKSLHAIKDFKCLLPKLVFGTHMQQTGESCSLRMECGTFDYTLNISSAWTKCLWKLNDSLNCIVASFTALLMTLSQAIFKPFFGFFIEGLINPIAQNMQSLCSRSMLTCPLILDSTWYWCLICDSCNDFNFADPET